MRDHAVADLDRRGEALRVGAAVALDDDAVEAEEDAAIDPARVHLRAQPLEGVAGEQVADAGQQRPAHRRAQIAGDLPRRALRRLQRDVAGEALGDHHVDRALADIVALDEAEIVEIAAGRPRAACWPASRDLLQALDLLDADVEQADGRPLDVEERARHGRAHHGEVEQLLGVGADASRRQSSTTLSPRSVGQSAAIAGRSMPAMVRRQNFAIAISAPVLPAETAKSASPLLHRLDRPPHARAPAAVAQRLARLVVHRDGDVAVLEDRDAALTRG